MDPTNLNNDSRKRTIQIPAVEIQFDKSLYDNDILGRNISQEEFNSIIDMLNKVSIEAFFRARKSKGTIYPSTYRILICTVLLNIIMLIIGSYESISIVFSVLFIIAINALIIILILLIYLTPINHLSKPDLFIKEVINKKLKEINGKYDYKLNWKYDAFEREIIITAHS